MDIKSFFQTYKYPIIIIGVLILVIIGMGIGMSALNSKKVVIKQNLDAAMDTLRVERLKNGELIASKESYVAEIKDLEEYIGITEAEMKAIKKNLDDEIMYVGKLEALIELKDKIIESKDTVVVIDSSRIQAPWKFTDGEWYTVMGKTVISGKNAISSLDSLSMNLSLKVGLTDDWRIFVTSKNPYLTVGELEGAVLDENYYLKKRKKQRFTFSANIGIQGGYYVGFDTKSKGIYRGPGVGVGFGLGLSYNF